MAIETREVRDLVNFAPAEYLVTSLYLDVNADTFPSPQSIMTSFDSLIHEAEDKRKDIEGDLSHETEKSVRNDLERIRNYIGDDFKRDNTNGVAIFSCSAEDFWEVYTLPTPVQNRVVFARRPYVAPLATFLSHSKPTAILLTDRRQARVFTMGDGHVKEWGDIETDVPSRSDQGGWSQMRYQRRSDHWAKHHVDHVADLVLRLEQLISFDWLILGTDVDAEHDLKTDLHPYLKDRVIGQIHVRIDAPEAEVIEAARTVRDEAESRLIDDLIDRIQEYAGAGGRGTIGLEPTLAALNEQKVHILVVQQDYCVPGAICRQCDMLLPEGSKMCPACGSKPEHVDNVVDAAIQKAFDLGSQIEVATEFEKLKPIENIGAILYY